MSKEYELAGHVTNLSWGVCPNFGDEMKRLRDVSLEFQAVGEALGGTSASAEVFRTEGDFLFLSCSEYIERQLQPIRIRSGGRIVRCSIVPSKFNVKLMTDRLFAVAPFVHNDEPT